MECKCINFCNNLIDVDELIDTLWNVNALAQHFEESENSELIDTLWNVNASVIIVPVQLQFELIDTLWNVNVSELVKGLEDTLRINRYIMECK